MPMMSGLWAIVVFARGYLGWQLFKLLPEMPLQFSLAPHFDLSLQSKRQKTPPLSLVHTAPSTHWSVLLGVSHFSPTAAPSLAQPLAVSARTKVIR